MLKASLRGRHYQRRRAQSARSGRHGISDVRTQRGGVARVPAHGGFWQRGGNLRLKNPLGRPAGGGLSRRDLDSTRDRGRASGGGRPHSRGKAAHYRRSASLRSSPQKNYSKRFTTIGMRSRCKRLSRVDHNFTDRPGYVRDRGLLPDRCRAGARQQDFGHPRGRRGQGEHIGFVARAGAHG